MSVEELLQHVPPEAVYRRTPLPDDENALGPWRQAVDHVVKPEDGSEEEDLWATLIYGDGEDGHPVDFPAGEEGKPLRKLLAKNQTALELLREGVRRGRLQTPESRRAIATREYDEVCHYVCQACFIQAKVFATDRQFTAAAKELTAMLRMGEMVCNGEGFVGDYLIGEWIRASALNGIRRLAAREDVPEAVLTECLTAVEQSLRAPDGLETCLRVDLCHDVLVQLDQLGECEHLEPFVDRLLETCYSSEPTFPDEEVPDDDRADWRRRQILSLLQDHPQPFDKAATARLIGKRVAQSIRGLNHPHEPKAFDLIGKYHSWCRRARQRRRNRGTQYWPVQLEPDFPFEELGPSEHARGKLAERFEPFDETTLEQISEDMREQVKAYLDSNWEAASQPPTDDDVIFCRKRLRRVANPVGRILADHLPSTGASEFKYRYRIALEETCSQLAERLTLT